MDRQTFVNHVTAAVAHLNDYAWLATCPLAELLLPGGENRGEGLSQMLATAIRRLRPRDAEHSSAISPEWRQYRHLLLRYALGASPKQIRDEFSISERQTRRDHLDGLEALGTLLWQYYQQLEEADTVARVDPSSGLAASDSAALEHEQLVQAEVARLEVTLPSGPTMVEETVRGVLDIVARVAASRGILFETHFGANPCFVATDRAVLRQILLNFLTYLIEGHHDTIIRMSTEGSTRERVEARLEVGCLLATIQAGHDGYSPPLSEGADSRLAVCHRLLATQGGSLRLNDDIGGAHIAYLTLPAVLTATVLVIDDNPDFIRLFQRYLRDQTYRVYHASSAERALDLAREIRPDVITLDVMMPSRDGWDILQALKSQPTTRDIPVIVCSVLREEVLAKSLGAATFLTKPIGQPALLAALERCRTELAPRGRRG